VIDRGQWAAHIHPRDATGIRTIDTAPPCHYPLGIYRVVERQAITR